MGRSTRRPRRPKLTPEIIEDDEKLAAVIDDFIRTSPVMRAHARRVRKRHDTLRRAVDDDHWAAVIALDDGHVDRVADLSVLLVRWAFDAGAQFIGVAGKRPAG